MARTARIALVIAIGTLPWIGSICSGGMPALLPTDWTADQPTPSWVQQSGGWSTHAARWQAMSFFIACLLLTAWGFKAIWNSLRSEFTILPRLNFWRAAALVVLWGFCFAVVLAMVSGARELMTPGAWKKQGWTYKLADSSEPADKGDQRRQALEKLRFALWNFAAQNAGRFPSEGDAAIDDSHWEIPGWPGLRFVYVPGQSVGEAGRLLAFEPEVEGDERQVLLTNGLLGTMRTAEIERALIEEPMP